MPRFLNMEREHGSVIRALRKQDRSPTVKEDAATSGARYSLFLSFDRGMQLLTDKLADAIANSSSGSIRLNTRVESLELQHATPNEPANWKIRTSNNETLTADAVCLALPSFVCARLLRNIDGPLASELDKIAYASSSTINLAYQREDIPHPLDGFGFVVPFVEKRSLIACTFSSVKFAGRAPHDRVLLRAFVGGALQPEMFGLDDAELISRVRSDLRDLLGIERPPLFGEVSNWKRSMPQYTLGHLEKVMRIQERANTLPNLTLAGNAYSGPGIPDCIRSGETGADQLIEMLAN
jgi:oxygen-dependent protoporphyrinogen oxidase